MFLPLFLLWIVSGTIIRGLVFAKLWDWFLIPNLHVPPIGAAQALGIALLVSVLTDHGSASSVTKSDGSSSVTRVVLTGIFKSIIYSLVILAMGALYHSFM